MVSEPDEQPSLAQQVAYHASVRYAIQALNAIIYEVANELGIPKGIISQAIDTGNRIRDDLGDEITSQIRDRIYEAIEREEEIRVVQQAKLQAKIVAALQAKNEPTASS